MTPEQREFDFAGAERKPRRWSFWRIAVAIYAYAWAAFLLAAVAAGLGVFLVYEHVTQKSPAGPRTAFTVPEGASGQAIGRLLSDAGYIEHEAFFRLAMRLDRSGKPLRAGVYQLPHGYSASQLLEVLQGDPAQQAGADAYKVTIPEGLTIAQIAALLEDPAILEAAGRPEFLSRVPPEAPSLEGFLMPDTYFFPERPAAGVLIARMLDEFDKVWARLEVEYPEAAVRAKLEVVTMASMVEEEAKAGDERAKVAAVLYNRVAREMPLQMDSTLQFALGKYGQRMLDDDKRVDSPYNTYLYAGLPPGPIANPGEASLRAALRPAETDDLYFVSNADGQTHTFSRTLAEHNAAVARYRREIAVQRRAEAAAAPASN